MEKKLKIIVENCPQNHKCPAVNVWAQQGPPGLATHSAGCCLLQLWPIPALLQLLRPGRGRQLLRHRSGGDRHGSCEATASYHLNCT